MITLFSNTGIQFINLDYSFEIDTDEYIVNLIRGNWTPIILDASNRDYGRIFWKVKGQSFHPILAIDTKLGEHSKGHFTEADYGFKFNSNSIENIFPPESQIFEQYLNTLHNHMLKTNKLFSEKYRDKSTDTIKEYKTFLTRLNQQTSNSIAGEFEFTKSTSELDVNIYLDLGNSRTVGVFFEDNDKANEFGQAVFPLKMIDYDALLKSTEKKEYYDEDIFSSRLEFRKSIFNNYNIHSTTFNDPSIVSIGTEAHTLSVKYNPAGTDTGISGPKRYIWDNKKHNKGWYISDGEFKDHIKGEILKYLTPDGNYQDPTMGLDAPNPIYPKKSLTTFFLIEIINQAFRYINSPEHREANSALRKRCIKRIVLTNPTGWTKWMEDKLLFEAQNAVKIFCKFMNIEPFKVELGLDEATSAQIVFVHSQLNKFGQNINSFAEDIFIMDDKNNFRIASIDIGGGTTDVMVSEYNLNSFNEINQLKGEIIFRDGTSTGGDDLVKDLIEQYLYPNIFNACGITPESKAYDILKNESKGVQTAQLRIQVMNNVMLPIAYYCLQCYSKNNEPNFENSTTLTEILNTLDNSILNLDKGTLNNIRFDMKEHLDWDFEETLINPLTLPSIKSFENKILKNSPLYRILFSYSNLIYKFNPSFILLAGKVTELDVIVKIIKQFMPSSPDRIIKMNNYNPGKWYPFIKEDRIRDPKSTIIVGAAISDISLNSQHFKGCNVYVDKALHRNANFINYSHVKGNDKMLFNINANGDSERIPLTVDYIIKYKNINDDDFPGNPMYKISLKSGIRHDNDQIPSLQLIKNSDNIGSFEINEQSLRGNVIVNDSTESLTIDHIEFHPQMLSEEYYYLDTGEFELDI